MQKINYTFALRKNKVNLVFQGIRELLLFFVLLLCSMYYVYVLKSKVDGTTYIGYTEDVEKRLKEHNSGGTKSIKHKIPLELVYTEEYESKTEARKRELRLKNNSSEKEQLYKRIFPEKYKK